MKRMLLVGKFNDLTKNLNKELSAYFTVQLCSDNLELLQGIMQMGKPDIVLISAVGLEECHKEIFSYLNQNSQSTPVLCIGNREELDFVYDYLEDGRIKKIKRPVLISDIIAVANESLGICIEEKSWDDSGIRKGSKVKKTILLVDDVAIQLRSMEGMLRKDYNVQMATSGMEAIKILKNSRPDLLLLDYDMPDCDGKKTFELIRSEKNGRDVPIIFVTGVSDKKRIMAVLNLKPAGYLIKPVKHDKLMETVQQALKESNF